MTTYSSYEAAVAAGAKSTDQVREECGNCEGGRKSWFAHVLNGVCFQCNGRGYFTVQVRTIKRRERRVAKLAEEQAAKEQERVAAIAARAQWDTDNSEVAQAIQQLADGGSTFAQDLLDLHRIPTEKQVEAVLRIKAEQATKEANKVDVPEGRGEVTGKVISVKQVLDSYSFAESYITKILVEDPRGFRVYGTCPKEVSNQAYFEWVKAVEADGGTTRDFGPEAWFDALKGREVSFTATLQAKEKGFGFFKRPTKGSIND